MIAQIKMRRGTTAEWAAASPVVLAAGEPGWDSTLKGMKVGDGSTEWAALPWIDAKNRPDINADTLDGVHLADIRLGQNLLHNWDWRNNPVNQRNVSGTITSAGYFYDRWYAYAANSLTINSGYVACTKIIEQKIEGLGLAGKVATFSMMVDNVIYAKTLTFPLTTGSVSSGENMPTTIVFAHDTTDMKVRLNAPSTELNYQAFKLELGTVSTLHLDPPMDYAVELAKCQRFCLPVEGGGVTIFSGYTFSTATSYRFMIPTPVPMRIVPTTNAVGESIRVYIGSAIAPTSIDSLSLSPSGIMFNTTIPSGAAVRTSYNGRVENSFMLFSDL